MLQFQGQENSHGFFSPLPLCFIEKHNSFIRIFVSPLEIVLEASPGTPCLSQHSFGVRLHGQTRADLCFWNIRSTGSLISCSIQWGVKNAYIYSFFPFMFWCFSDNICHECFSREDERTFYFLGPGYFCPSSCSAWGNALPYRSLQGEGREHCEVFFPCTMLAFI